MNQINKPVNIIIASNRPWTKIVYERTVLPKKYKTFLISKQNKLTLKSLSELKPAYIFFPHWSWKIPPEIYNNFECIGFHMTNLPYGRGGSPLQNLISRGIMHTKISAMKIVENFDAGDIYLKRDFDISFGSAEEIYLRASRLVFQMIKEIIKTKPIPKPQSGKVIIFKRRSPAESKIPNNLKGKKLNDFIRMLDADGYPNAFIEIGRQRFEFSQSKINSQNQVEAKVIIRTVK